MHVSDLITDSALGLELATPSTAESLTRRVRAVVATESLFPSTYLEPDTLVLTTGMSPELRDAATWHTYVKHLVDGDVAALAFGLGPSHPKVPQGLCTAARALDLPILVVPVDVPFLRLQQAVSRTIADERFRNTRRAWDIAGLCTARAAFDDNPSALLELIRAETNICLSVVDDAGAVFIAAPPDVAQDEGPHHIEFPVALGEEAVWSLQARVSLPADARILLSPATTVVAMVLARQLSTHPTAATRRLSDILSNPATETKDLRAELIAEGLGGAPTIQAMRIASRTVLRQNLLARRVASKLGDAYRTLLVTVDERTILLIAPVDCSAQLPTDRSLRETVSAQAGDGILIAEPAQSVAQLALSVALTVRAPSPRGVDYSGAPRLDDIVQLIPETLRSALVDGVLGPLLRTRDSQKLLDALTALLATSSVSGAAVMLEVHRNTAQSLRARIEEVLAVNLDEGSERTALGVALAIHEQLKDTQPAHSDLTHSTI